MLIFLSFPGFQATDKYKYLRLKMKLGKTFDFKFYGEVLPEFTIPNKMATLTPKSFIKNKMHFSIRFIRISGLILEVKKVFFYQ